MKRVYLIRHGDAEFMGRGRGDHGRILTAEGQEQAKRLGAMLAPAGVQVILCSSADRARETAEGLGLTAKLVPLDELYNAGTFGLMQALASLADSVQVAALVAHAPGVPALVDELAGQDPDPDAAAVVRYSFPTATVAGIEFTGSWADLEGSRLFWADRG
ncbi:MAG: histidine phosphatase family protein [Propioniciclava sp.]|uniref:SixA phosphatase family protein n=1 Tax=Propioniciclava sp. TaxID=2038686 RepID=UPI0039E6F926